VLACAALVAAASAGAPALAQLAHGLEHWPSRSATAVAVDHAAHLLCNRLGIGPREEVSLRALAARAARDLAAEGAVAGAPLG
jgi:hypothetical protein